jgi:hypothetical protein
MTVLKSADGILLLQGACPSEDAETLLRHLLRGTQSTVDLRDCQSLHTAVFQVLLAAKAKVLGPPPTDTPLWRWSYPALNCQI